MEKAITIRNTEITFSVSCARQLWLPTAPTRVAGHAEVRASDD
jgi:hypothetical protein